MLDANDSLCESLCLGAAVVGQTYNLTAESRFQNHMVEEKRRIMYTHVDRSV